MSIWNVIETEALFDFGSILVQTEPGPGLLGMTKVHFKLELNWNPTWLESELN